MANVLKTFSNSNKEAALGRLTTNVQDLKEAFHFYAGRVPKISKIDDLSRSYTLVKIVNSLAVAVAIMMVIAITIWDQSNS